MGGGRQREKKKRERGSEERRRGWGEEVEEGGTCILLGLNYSPCVYCVSLFPLCLLFASFRVGVRSILDPKSARGVGCGGGVCRDENLLLFLLLIMLLLLYPSATGTVFI